MQKISKKRRSFTHDLIDKLILNSALSESEYAFLIDSLNKEAPLCSKTNTDIQKAMSELPLSAYLFERAQEIRDAHYGHKVFLRGLIECTNYCKNDCFYCGIRCSNRSVNRYRLTQEEILSCCEQGYQKGFRTFVLQGGEDRVFNDEVLTSIVKVIHASFPDCAITLSFGERSKASYQKLFNAGASRYLLRHETADEKHYKSLHPARMQSAVRKQCLSDLRSIGYQVGAGMMIGTPNQTAKHLASDLVFLHKLQPHMVGIGPFIPHPETPFAHHNSGNLLSTLHMIALTRLTLPATLLPSTTALASLHPQGRVAGLHAGANVVMPNLSPLLLRKNYELYANKVHTDAESVEGLFSLTQELTSAGYQISWSRGDSLVL